MLAQDFETQSIWLETFETESSLKNWKVVGDGHIELSNERFKIGKQSLKWAYKENDLLRLTGCRFLSRLNEYPGGQGIKLWIYNENSVNDDMVIKIGKAALITAVPAYYFTFHMNFKGWRAIWIRVNDSAQTADTHVLSDLDAIQFELPISAGSGTLYLDAFEVMESVSYLLCPDFQAPYLPANGGDAGLHYASYRKIPLNAGDEKDTEEYRRAFQIITERLDDYILPQGVDFLKMKSGNPARCRYDELQKLIGEKKKEYDSYHIRRGADGKILGPGLLAGADRMECEHHLFRDFEKIWIALVLDYKLNCNENSKEKLMDLFDHFYDQGWAEGSSCGAMRFDEIRGSGYAYAVYMMRKELKESGRLDRELATLRWRSEFGMIFSYDAPELAHVMKLTCDKVRGEAVFQLLYILAMEDSALKNRYMKQYLKYLKFVIEPKPAFGNVIKCDYTMWNHQGPYMSAYGLEALNILCHIKYLVHGTCFDLDEESTQTLCQVLRTYRKSSNKLDIPIRLRGRMPAANGTMLDLAAAYAFMAACGSREMTEIFMDIWDFRHPEIQKRFLGILPEDMLTDGKLLLPDLIWLATPGQFPLYQKVLAKAEKEGFHAAKRPEGHFVFPYGGYCIWRHSDWMVAVGGWSCYIWDYENGAVENQYGRYMNYGTAMIIPADGFIGGGIDTEHGWDWCRWPGATTKYLEEKELRNNEEMRYQSDESFLGGVSADSGDGIYAMKLHDAHFDKSFHANKSWFAFGEEMICLGSDICCDDKEHPVETTLFQCGSGENLGEIFRVNGMEIAEDHYETVVRQEDGIWLTDPYGNGYIVPNAKGLIVERRVRKAKSNTGKDSSGMSTVAYLSHGEAPESAGYEYVLLPQKTEKEVERAARNPDYSVLQKNCFAHVVKNMRSNAVGYVVFKAGTRMDYGILQQVDTPCVALERTMAEDECLLHFADPDLRANDFRFPGFLQKVRPHTVKALIKGRWMLKNGREPGVKIFGCGENTTLEFACADGKQIDVWLVRGKRK